MALTGTNRGSGGNNTSSTSLVISPTSNFTPNSFGILCICFDNAGAQGSDPSDGALTWTDSAGNLWSFATFSLNDPNTVNNGSALTVITAPISTFTTGNTITYGFATATVAKAWTLTEVVSSTGGVRLPITGTQFASNTDSTATPTITSIDTIPTGEFILGVVGRENNGTRTGDADTTNGSWSTAQSTGFGTTTSGQEIISQFKVVTGAGTQTYNPTFGGAAADGNIAYLRAQEYALSSTFDPMGMMGFFGM